MKKVSGGSTVPAVVLLLFGGLWGTASCADRYVFSSPSEAGAAGAIGDAGGGGAASTGGDAGAGNASTAGDGNAGASEVGSGGEAGVEACVSGAEQCAGSQPQVCDPNGAWQDSGLACGGCTSCSEATASCVVDTGAECDDDNACTSGETCQANGACGGGSMESLTTSCGNNEFCDGNGACQCRTKSSWNLLTNPGFNDSVVGWTLAGGAAYTTNDVDSCSGSGSVSLETLGATFSQCLPVQANQTYYFGYRFKASGGPSSAGTANCYISFLPAGNTCQVSQATGGGDGYQSYNNDNWILGSGSATSDADTTHVLLVCSSPASAGYHDQLYLSKGSPGVPPF